LALPFARIRPDGRLVEDASCRRNGWRVVMRIATIHALIALMVMHAVPCHDAFTRGMARPCVSPEAAVGSHSLSSVFKFDHVCNFMGRIAVRQYKYRVCIGHSRARAASLARTTFKARRQALRFACAIVRRQFLPRRGRPLAVAEIHQTRRRDALDIAGIGSNPKRHSLSIDARFFYGIACYSGFHAFKLRGLRLAPDARAHLNSDHALGDLRRQSSFCASVSHGALDHSKTSSRQS
jgi:hypothetical protein